MNGLGSTLSKLKSVSLTFMFPRYLSSPTVDQKVYRVLTCSVPVAAEDGLRRHDPVRQELEVVFLQKLPEQDTLLESVRKPMQFAVKTRE